MNVNITDEEELKSILWRLDKRLIPFLTVLYVFSFLSRISIGHAKLTGIQKDLDLTSLEYSWAVSTVLFGYILFVIPSLIILRSIGPKIWIPTITIVRSSVLLLMILVYNTAGLLIARFFLGVAEAGIFPCVIHYLSLWYPKQYQPLRMALFFSGSLIANIVGGLLAYAATKIGNYQQLAPWKWLFVLESVPGVIIGITAYFLLPKYPESGTWLSQSEKDTLANVLEYEGGETNERLWHEGVSWEEIKFVFTDVKVYLYAIIEFGILISFYSLSLSLTGIIEGMGFSNTAIIQLMTVPPFAIAWISCVAISYTAGRLKERGFFTSAAIFIGLIGFVLLIVLKPYGFFPLYLASTLACTGTFTAIPLNLSWVTSNISGQTKRAISLSTIIGFSNLAGIVSSQIYREDDRPEIIPSHTTGYIVCISFMSVSLLVALFLKYHLSRENRLQ